MSRVEELETNHNHVLKMIDEKEGTFEERQTKIVSASLFDIAKSLAVIVDALSCEKED